MIGNGLGAEGRGVQKRFLRANEGSRKRQHRLGAKMGKCKTWWKTPNQVALSFASKEVVIKSEIGCKVNWIARKLVIVILTQILLEVKQGFDESN